MCGTIIPTLTTFTHTHKQHPGPVPRDLTRISATNVDASKSSVPAGYCGGDALPSLYPGTWFQIIGTGSLVTIMACSPQNFDGYTFSVYAGDAGTCATLACTAPGTYQINGIDPDKCTFGGSPRPLTSYTFATMDRTRYYVYVHFARTRADKPTGDVRFYVDDGADGNGSSSGAHVIRYDEDGYDEHDATTTAKNSTTATPITNTNPNNNNNNNNNNIDDSGNVNNGGETTPQGINDRNPADTDGDEGWNKLWLLMLLLIIPLCILFFCWYRKRNEYRDDVSEDSEDRDAWLDAGDAWLDDDGVEDGTRQARGTRSDSNEDDWDSEDDSDDDSDIYKEDEDDSDDDSDDASCSIYDDVVGESEESSESDDDNNEDDSTIDEEFNTEYSSSRLDGRNNN